MKKLLLIRHAKAAHETNTGDFARPLKTSGEKDALALAKSLKLANLLPQQVYTSPALRAKTTAEIITENLGLSDAIHIPGVYEAQDPTLLKIITEFPDKFDFIALTGHNPGLSSISTYLTGQYLDMPTCAAVLINFEVGSWAMVSADTGQIAWVNQPD